MATISYIEYFTLDCWLGSETDTWKFCKNMMFIAKHAINLIGIELTGLCYVHVELHLNQMIRSLHDLVRTAASEHFDCITIYKCCKRDQILWKEGFHKTCAWAVAVIEQMRSDPNNDVDINSIEAFHHKYVYCAEVPAWQCDGIEFVPCERPPWK